MGRTSHLGRRHGLCPARTIGGSLPCGRNSLTFFIVNKAYTKLIWHRKSGKPLLGCTTSIDSSLNCFNWVIQGIGLNANFTPPQARRPLTCKNLINRKIRREFCLGKERLPTSPHPPQCRFSSQNKSVSYHPQEESKVHEGNFKIKWAHCLKDNRYRQSLSSTSGQTSGSNSFLIGCQIDKESARLFYVTQNVFM